MTQIIALPVPAKKKPRPLGFVRWWRQYDACRALAGRPPSAAGEATRYFLSGMTPDAAAAASMPNRTP